MERSLSPNPEKPIHADIPASKGLDAGLESAQPVKPCIPLPPPTPSEEFPRQFGSVPVLERDARALMEAVRPLLTWLGAIRDKGGQVGNLDMSLIDPARSAFASFEARIKNNLVTDMPLPTPPETIPDGIAAIDVAPSPFNEDRRTVYIQTTCQDYAVTDPFASVCGRFTEDPATQYGLTPGQVRAWWVAVRSLRAEGTFDELTLFHRDEEINRWLEEHGEEMDLPIAPPDVPDGAVRAPVAPSLTREPFTFENRHARMEIQKYHAWVRELDEHGGGGGVISSTLTERQQKAFRNAVEKATSENPDITFSEIWKVANTIRGANFTYRSY